MAEGKTLVPNAPCDLCEGDDSVNFCTNCQQDLCLRCSTAHRKIPDLSHHKLRPVTDRTSVVVPKTTQAYCKEHPSQPLSVICEECLKALCGTCADSEHRTHKLLRTNLNAELLQRVCVQKVPEFLDLLQKLDKEKDGSPLKLQLYKQARTMVKSWRSELLKIIEDASKELLEQLEKEIKNQEALLADISSNLKDIVSTAEQQMSVLGNARKINNPVTLLLNIHEGDKTIAKVKSLLNEIETTRESFTIDDLLPFRSKIKTLENSLHTCFNMTPLPHRRRNYTSMVKAYSHQIGNLDIGHFRISESCQGKIVFIYDVNTSDIYKFDLDSKNKSTFTCAKSVLRMASLTDDRHVMVDRKDRNVHLLDRDFNILNTLERASEDAGKARGVYPLSTNVFILSENLDTSRARLSEVTISQTNTFTKKILCNVDFKDYFGCLSFHRDNRHITTSSSDKTMHTVDLQTDQLTVLDLQTYCGSKLEIKSMCVDAEGQILVGDSEGNIHLTTTKAYKCTLKNMKSQGWAGGISIRGGKVVIAAGEYLYIYQ